MATILAARLQLQNQVDEAIAQLSQAGFAPGKMTAFYVNPPGQHAVYPIGGDRFQSPGKPVLGERADVHVETLVDSFLPGQRPQAPAADPDTDSTESVELRKSGMLVAVEVDDQAGQDRAIALFSSLGAVVIETAQGKIVDSEWRDFDPLSEPNYV